MEPIAHDDLQPVVGVLVGLEAHGGHVPCAPVVTEEERGKETLN